MTDPNLRENDLYLISDMMLCSMVTHRIWLERRPKGHSEDAVSEYNFL